MKIVIQGEFPTLNEIIKASKSHYGAYSKQKKMYTQLVQYQTMRTKKIKGLNNWTFIWYRKNKRNDPDNIQVGTKYILDGLVEMGIIENDGWKQINSIKHEYAVDKDNPRVEIIVNEV